MRRTSASVLFSICAGFAGCNPPSEPAAAPPPKPAEIPARVDAATVAAPAAKPAPDLAALEKELVRRHGLPQQGRIASGLKQVAALWKSDDKNGAGDGDLAAFAREHFVSDPVKLAATLSRLEGALEQLDGHLNEINRELRRPSELDTGPLLPVDALLGSYDPWAHVTEDLFANKTAFVALLNFPQTTLAERLSGGEKYTREQWAEVRLTGRYARRIPGPVQQRITEAQSAGERYIASYNIWLHHVVDEKGQRLFPKGLRLISHWNLRDQIRADYGNPQSGLARQRAIAKIMERIVEQSIPRIVIDNPRVDWDPFANTVKPVPKDEVATELEADAPPPSATVDEASLAAREPDLRYALLLDNFQAQRQADPYSPSAPTLIARSFELGRELPEERVVAMLREVCGSPLMKRVAGLIEKRLGRPLEPHDLWYAGFRPRSRPEPELDRIVAARYPTAQAFEADIPRILKGLGFAPDKAKFLAEHIRVDPSRGAGHAMQAMRRGDFPHLRTRIEKGGMNYKGYNIAIHELGHNVEQVFSLYGVDHTLLAGVPNNAFTEALAFVFQQRDLALLGLAQPDPAAHELRVISDFFATWEIAGVALVEIAAWHFMYNHPKATPAELRQAMVEISRDTWNRYYAPVLGKRDSLLLGIYSHMIQNTLYLPDYPLGHLIAFQIEEHLRKLPPGGTTLGKEFERMATFGQVTPDLWLTHATGAPLSTGPILHAAEAALAKLAPN